MHIEQFQVDAFTSNLFGGNPAAVCPLDKWLPDELLQKIAMENNYAETAYYVPKGDEFELRWFTPKAEVDLCGHATLATSYVIFEIKKTKQPVLKFHTRSGILSVARSGEEITMNFPRDTFDETEVTDSMKKATGSEPESAWKGKNVLMLVVRSEKELLDLVPDFEKIKLLHPHGLIVTAEGVNSDFVSRCFFPRLGINEDPVTGSAHTILAPYWANRLNKTVLTAKQLSERRGELLCKIVNERVEISGKAILFLKGTIHIE